MQRRTSRINPFVVLVAAAVLFVQATLGALAAADAPVQRDIFGNVLCIGDDATPSPAGDHGAHLPACCVLGCAAGVIGLPPDRPFSYTPSGTAAMPPDPPHASIVLASRRTPANPRAPPVVD